MFKNNELSAGSSL